jgi:hypothetical protein
MTSKYDGIVIGGLTGNRRRVTFCDADACCSCGLVEGHPDCLRRKANFCRWLAARFPRLALGTALNKLGFDLLRDAEALDREHLLSRRKRAAT